MANDFRAIERSVGHSPKAIMDRPNIAMLQKAVGPELPELFLVRQLKKFVDNVNVDARLNLQQEQIPGIAEYLTDAFPVESLEDFVLCFRRVMTGAYGTIYKIDKSEIFGWFGRYLEEKYVYVEERNQRQKEEGVKQDEVNYNAFKKRIAEHGLEPKVENNQKQNELAKFKLGYKQKLTPEQQQRVIDEAKKQGFI